MSCVAITEAAGGNVVRDCICLLSSECPNRTRLSGVITNLKSSCVCSYLTYPLSYRARSGNRERTRVDDSLHNDLSMGTVLWVVLPQLSEPLMIVVFQIVVSLQMVIEKFLATQTPKLLVQES